MIARTWSGTTRASDADTYVEYLGRTGFAEYAATPGNVGVIGLRRWCGDHAEFLLVSLWDGPESITRFAGPDPGRAVFYPEDDAYLLDRDDYVDHYEVVHQQCRSSPRGERRNAIQRLLGRARAWWRRGRPAAAAAASGEAVPRPAGSGWTLIGLR